MPALNVITRSLDIHTLYFYLIWQNSADQSIRQINPAVNKLHLLQSTRSKTHNNIVYRNYYEKFQSLHRLTVDQKNHFDQ